MRQPALLLLLLLATACASTPPAPEASVRAAMTDFMEALNSLDVDGMAAFFADDVTAFVPNAQGPRVEGKAALVEIFRRYVEATRKTTARTNLVPEDLEVDAYRDVAIVSFNLPGPDAFGRRTFVFRREGSRWRISHFHASTFRPAGP
ncbi:MAG TPA: nuclear transport factor 2 family protein [Thermoanaerobaculia bacterium]|nr:nuclear transport factor 2 family protein [Thermoanaerobaculia bacterium]